IFIAIIAHKGLDSFALCMNVKRSAVSQSQHLPLLVLFSLMTPLGIMIVSTLTLWLQSQTGQLLQAILNSLGAGAFIYLATAHKTNHYLHSTHALHALYYLLAVSAGLAAMAALAVWV